MDNLHISSSLPTTLSVHAWWVNTNCSTTKAIVTVGIQKRNAAGLWFNADRPTTNPGKKTVFSGGGSANRANARYECFSVGQLNTYRTWVDVDLVGIADTPGRSYSGTYSMWCD